MYLIILKCVKKIYTKIIGEVSRNVERTSFLHATTRRTTNTVQITVQMGIYI